MLTLRPDLKITRRQRHHCIFDVEEKLVWSGKDIIHALDWCLANDITELIVAAEDRQCYLTLAVFPP